MANEIKVPFCPVCKETRDGKFCFNCGTELIEAIAQCSTCGREGIRPHEKFCRDCGTEVQRG